MPDLILPPPICPGQKVQVIAPSGAIREWERLEAGIKIWRDRGYEISMPSEFAAWGYLAGTDGQRGQQLLEAWNDPETVAILAARGGYGATRLLENWQWQEMRSPAKWLIGFSDLTALLWGIASVKNIIGLHAPVLTSLATEPASAIAQMFDWLEGKIWKSTLTGTGWGGGIAQGLLLPGNLNVATHLIGTGLIPQWQNIILAIEDVAEPPYKVDRMLTQWRMSGLLAQVVGVCLGRFSFAPLPPDRPSLSMAEVWRDRLGDLGIPMVIDLPFGHQGENVALLVGGAAELDGDRGTLRQFNQRSLCPPSQNLS